MTQGVRNWLFIWFLGVPGTFVQITGWFFLVVSMGEVTTGSTDSSLLLTASLLLSLAVFLIGRLMSLASAFLTGTLTIPESKRPFAISLIFQLSVQILVAAILSQVVAFLLSAAKGDHAAMLRSGSACGIFVSSAIVTQISSDRFREKVQREGKELRKRSQNDD